MPATCLGTAPRPACHGSQDTSAIGQGLVLGASSQRAQGSRQTTHSRVTAPQAQYS